MHRPLSLLPLLALMGVASAGSGPPAESFGNLPAVTNVVVSADGKMLAWAANNNNNQQIVMHDLVAGRAKRIFAVPTEYSIRTLSWFDGETLLMNVSKFRETRGNKVYRTEVYRTLAYDASGGAGRVLLMKDSDHEWVNQGIMVRPRISKPGAVMMWTLEISLKQSIPMYVPTLYEVAISDGRGEVTDRGNELTLDFVANSQGQAVARADWSPRDGNYRVLAKESQGVWREIYKQTGSALQFYGLSPDGKLIYAHGVSGQSHQKLWAIAVDGSGAIAAIDDPERDVASVMIDPLTLDAIGAVLGGPQPEVRWIDKKAEARAKSLAKAFPNRSIEIVSRSADFMKVVAKVDSPSNPTIYYLVDFASGKADVVGEEYPALAGAVLGTLQITSYKARDGHDIPAYLTMPARTVAGRTPLIVLPHGGPEARDFPQFDWLAQFLASRGYAVLQPQFRGSTGFGEAHRLAGYGQWGRLMQDDVTDGVQALAERGLIDKRQVCIVGASYGGYAALAGAAFTPQVYRCAVSINGVADLPMMIGRIKKYAGRGSGAFAYWEQHIGSPFDKKVIDASPAAAGGRITIPVLLMHAVNDTVVPIAQSESMERALAEAGKPQPLIRLDGEDHWLSRSATRIRVLQELDTFLGRHLPLTE